LQPDDTDAIVVHKALAAHVGVEVGDPLIVTRDGDKEAVWQVVGILFDPVTDEAIYLPQELLARFLGAANRANALWVQTQVTDAASNKATALALEERFTERGFALAVDTVFSGNTIEEIIFSKRFTYNLLIQLLAILAVVIAAVGGIGLSGVLTLNVLERTREIGVMRAIGASSGQITRLFIGEGLLLGVMSWIVALPFSIPFAFGLTTQLLTIILNEEIIYRFTLLGPALWLAVISCLSILASWFPARRATQVSVRESLAYQ
jgi:putative ABC transport system permease protein